MPITIKKGGATARTAPVVEGGLTAGEFPALSNEEALKRWKHLPSPDAKVKECEFCHQHYIVPCNKQRHEACANYRHLIGKAPY